MPGQASSRAPPRCHTNEQLIVPAVVKAKLDSAVGTGGDDGGRGGTGEFPASRQYYDVPSDAEWAVEYQPVVVLEIGLGVSVRLDDPNAALSVLGNGRGELHLEVL